jgi:small secreted domain DUF320
MSPQRRILNAVGPFSMAYRDERSRQRTSAHTRARKVNAVKNLKKAAAVTLMAGGIIAAGAGAASAHSDAVATAQNSPGLISGNSATQSTHMPVSSVGNAANVIGVLNPVFGNSATNF